MVCNTENEASLQKLPNKLATNFMKKRHSASGCYCWKLRKKKVKHEILFKNYSIRLGKAHRTIRADRRARAVEEMFMRKLPRTS